MAATSVPIFLPPGAYLLVLYRDVAHTSWSVAVGRPGIFDIVGSSSVSEQCMLAGLGVQATREEVIRAADNARHGPVEPLPEVIAALKSQLGPYCSQLLVHSNPALTGMLPCRGGAKIIASEVVKSHRRHCLKVKYRPSRDVETATDVVCAGGKPNADGLRVELSLGSP